MSSNVGPAVVGGLLIRNGKLRGTRVPLKLPVTVIGSAEGCDVRLTADGILPFHCLIAITPAGPIVRSWDSGTTLTNGNTTNTALLKHSDELKVGPCVFQIAWFGEIETGEIETGEIEANEQAVSVAEDESATHDWSMKEREESLHEQEIQIAQLLETKQRQVQELLSQLSEHREKFNNERENARVQLVAAGMVQERADKAMSLADAARQKNHATYRKLVLRAKRQRIEGEKANTVAANELKKQLAKFEKEKEEFASGKAKFLSEAAQSKQRMQDVWQQLNDGQRRLLDDRKASEKLLVEYQQVLDQRNHSLDRKDTIVNDAHARLENRCAELHSEISGLETRAGHISFIVNELEQKRITIEAEFLDSGHAKSKTAIDVASPQPVVTKKTNELVPLNSKKDRSFDELLNDVTLRERELEKEQKAIVVKKQEFERLTKDLADQRAVVVAQFTKITAAARMWQQAECVTASELEQLALAVDSRERAVVSREQKLLEAEESYRHRERELWAFRVKLEGWQAGLTAHESQWYAHRDQAEAATERQREHLAKWEDSLETLCRTWNELRMKERDASSTELEFWKNDRQEYITARSELDNERKAVAKQAQELATRMTATTELLEPANEKKLRVIKKRWESHFKKFEKLWMNREKAATKLTVAIEDKFVDMKKKIAKLSEDKAKFAATQQEWQAAKLASERVASEKEAVITLVAARARRSDRELAELRNEVERVSSMLMNTQMPSNEVVALVPSRAA